MKYEAKPKDFIEKLKKDFDFRTFSGAAVSFLITAAFALYNGSLGIYYASLWHGSICVYYLLLAGIRAYIVSSEKRLYKTMKNPCQIRMKTLKITSICLLFMNISLVIPVTLMVYHKKPVDMSLVPAIAMAAYTTYKITFASINLIKRKKTDNVLVKELRNISFMDALVSILTLQNTLIVVTNETKINDMLALTATTSAAVLLIITAMSLKGIFYKEQTCSLSYHP